MRFYAAAKSGQTGSAHCSSGAPFWLLFAMRVEAAASLRDTDAALRRVGPRNAIYVIWTAVRNPCAKRLRDLATKPLHSCLKASVSRFLVVSSPTSDALDGDKQLSETTLIDHIYE